MKALSIRQPWAWAILYAGKDVENRDWSPRYQGYRDAVDLAITRQSFLIHAAAGMTVAEYREFADFYRNTEIGQAVLTNSRPNKCAKPTRIPLPAFDQLRRGGFLGIARLSGLTSSSASPWFFGPVGLELRDVRPIHFIPFKGALGFFNVPTDIAIALEYELAPSLNKIPVNPITAKEDLLGG